MTERLSLRLDDEAFILSLREPMRVLSWAVLNGGFAYADHVINHHVRGSDRFFCAEPEKWLKQVVARLRLRGTVVAMATAVEMKNLVRVSIGCDGAEVTCFGTVGYSNALSVGDPATVGMAEPVLWQLHTINLILTVQPGLSDPAFVEAVQIATEARVRAVHEAGIRSSISSLAATGTGTDCIAVVALSDDRVPYCGKHTKLGELIGLAAFTAVKDGLARASKTNVAGAIK